MHFFATAASFHSHLFPSFKLQCASVSRYANFKLSVYWKLKSPEINSKMESLRGTPIIIARHTNVPRHGGWEPLVYGMSNVKCQISNVSLAQNGIKQSYESKMGRTVVLQLRQRSSDFACVIARLTVMSVQVIFARAGDFALV